MALAVQVGMMVMGGWKGACRDRVHGQYPRCGCQPSTGDTRQTRRGSSPAAINNRGIFRGGGGGGNSSARHSTALQPLLLQLHRLV